MRSSITLLLSLALVVCLVAASAVAADKRFEKKFAVTPGGTLTINTDVGDVRITGSSGSEVSIVAEVHGRQRDVDRFDISAKQTSNGVEVRGESSQSHWFSWGIDGPDAKFQIAVPHEYTVQVNTSGGNIVISNLKGRINGETSGGDLDIRDVEGAISLETSGGDIRAEKLVGDLHMATSGGDVQIQSVVGRVDVSTSGGNVKLSDIDGRVDAETSGGDIVVRVRGDNKGIHAETSGGNIDIVVPANIGATIDASTTGGDVRCDLPITMSGRLDESHIHGTVNGGGNSISASTSGGDVRIRKAE
jgi:DUF4097 and DUF4098 domain-containing protein YvlB